MSPHYIAEKPPVGRQRILTVRDARRQRQRGGSRRYLPEAWVCDDSPEAWPTALNMLCERVGPRGYGGRTAQLRLEGSVAEAWANCRQPCFVNGNRGRPSTHHNVWETNPTTMKPPQRKAKAHSSCQAFTAFTFPLIHHERSNSTPAEGCLLLRQRTVWRRSPLVRSARASPRGPRRREARRE